MDSGRSIHRTNDPIADIRNKFIQSFTLGFSFRWFSRILSTALSLFIEDLFLSHSQLSGKKEEIIDIYFNGKYLLDSMVLMGGTNDEFFKRSGQKTFDTTNNHQRIDSNYKIEYSNRSFNCR